MITFNLNFNHTQYKINVKNIMLWKITDTLIVYYILCLCVRLWGYLSLLSAYVQRAGLSGYATELWIYRCEYSSLSNSTVYAHASETAFRRHHEKFIHFHFYISPPPISSAPNWPQVMERVITFVDMLMFWSEESSTYDWYLFKFKAFIVTPSHLNASSCCGNGK